MTKHRAIIAIGGGNIRKASTLAIDKEIIRLSGKKHPKLMFIPTASSDSKLYWKVMDRYYGKRLGCKTDVLWLLENAPAHAEIRKKILGADIIYVGGGNTLMMMKLWRRLGVDRLLRLAWNRGIVLCGVSAGSICWFASGHSDSLSFYNPKRWKYINVRGLGFLKGIHCPHFNGHTLRLPRKKYFERMIGKIGGMGIAIDNDCAIAFVDDHFRVIPAKKKAGAHRVFKQKGKVVMERISEGKELCPVAELYGR
ncbi:MAG: Type 1 glutamine amidotransferase-like domain-containing protein [Patescibacteria group bacterium]